MDDYKKKNHEKEGCTRPSNPKEMHSFCDSTAIFVRVFNENNHE